MKEVIQIKNRYTVLVYFLFIAYLLITVSAKAQDSTKNASELRNSIKINLTAPILYNNATQISYERLIGKNQSLNIFGGYNEFPSDIKLNLDNTSLSNSSSKSGYMLGADYRFYLQKENKYSSPHGVYLAPYFSFYQFNGKRELIYTDSLGVQSSSGLKTNINFFNLGGELGYQFVLGKRWVIDAVVFGPAMTHYKFKATLDGAIPGLDENETIKAVIDALKEKFPLLNDLSGEHEVSSSGNEAFWSFGFRYNISVGFRF